MQFRQAITLAVKIAASLLLLVLALRGVDVHLLVERLSKISPGWLLGGVAVGLVQVYLHALRWRTVLAAAEILIRPLTAFRYCMIGMFFNQILPSGLGGDVARFWFVGRSTAWTQAAYASLVDRGFGVLALATMIVASLPFSMRLITAHSTQTAIALVGTMTLVSGLVFVCSGRLDWRWAYRVAALRHLHACAALAASLLFSRRRCPAIIALSIGIHVLSPVATYAASRSIQIDISLMHMMLLVPPVMMATMLPVSIGGWGLREATMAFVFASAGLSNVDGLLVSLLLGLSQLILGAFGGILWIALPDGAAVKMKSPSPLK